MAACLFQKDVSRSRVWESRLLFVANEDLDWLASEGS